MSAVVSCVVFMVVLLVQERSIFSAKKQTLDRASLARRDAAAGSPARCWRCVNGGRREETKCTLFVGRSVASARMPKKQAKKKRRGSAKVVVEQGSESCSAVAAPPQADEMQLAEADAAQADVAVSGAKARGRDEAEDSGDDDDDDDDQVRRNQLHAPHTFRAQSVVLKPGGP